MTSDYATLTPDMTAKEAIEALRNQALDAETVYQAYIIDEERQLVGVISLRDLIVARANARVRNLMDTNPVFIRAEEDREEAAQIISRYDLIALPVINGRRQTRRHRHPGRRHGRAGTGSHHRLPQGRYGCPGLKANVRDASIFVALSRANRLAGAARFRQHLLRRRHRLLRGYHRGASWRFCSSCRC